MTTPPRVLAVAGSDSGGGAGIQADLKTLHALGVHGLTAVTAVTAQNSRGVQGVWPVPAAAVTAQLDSVLGDIGVDAVKTGMLAGGPTVRAVAAALRGLSVPVVVDPVGASSHGESLLTPAGLAALRARLLPLATVATPNLDEVRALTGQVVRTEADLPAAAAALRALGPQWVLVKGGHLDGPESVDLLAGPGGAHLLRAPRLAAPHTHGTGCTLASALAAGLAAGLTVPDAARRAKRFVTRAIAGGYPLGGGTGPVNPGARRPDGPG